MKKLSLQQMEKLSGGFHNSHVACNAGGALNIRVAANFSLLLGTAAVGTISVIILITGQKFLVDCSGGTGAAVITVIP